MLFSTCLLLLSCAVSSIRAQAGYTEPSAGYFSLIVTIPESTSTLDNGDVQFTIQTAGDKGWYGVGIGSTMLGSLMLVVYPGTGNNVTVSPRLGLGEFLPQFYPQTDVIMREGSGIVSGQMKAVFTCQNCKKWLGGSLNVASDTQNWIWAVNPTDSIRTDSYSASITQHSDNGYGSFQMDMTSAVVSDAEAAAPAALPFIGGGAAATGGTVIPNLNNPIQAKKNRLIIAHGVIMGICFVLLFPFGAIMIRMLRLIIRQSFFIHVIVQLGSFLLAVAGVVIGVKASATTNTHFLYTHQFMGVIVIVLLFIQVILGGTHHTLYKARGKTWVTYVHIWFGRAVILFGIVTGGVGLPLAKSSSGAIGAYGGAAGVVAAVWILGFAGITFWEHKMKLEGDEEDNSPTSEHKIAGSFEMNDRTPTGELAPPVVNYNKHQSIVLPAAHVYNPRMSALWIPEQYDASREYPKPHFSPQTMFAGVEESPPLKQEPFSVIERK